MVLPTSYTGAMRANATKGLEVILNFRPINILAMSKCSKKLGSVPELKLELENYIITQAKRKM